MSMPGRVISYWPDLRLRCEGHRPRWIPACAGMTGQAEGRRPWLGRDSRPRFREEISLRGNDVTPGHRRRPSHARRRPSHARRRPSHARHRHSPDRHHRSRDRLRPSRGSGNPGVMDPGTQDHPQRETALILVERRVASGARVVVASVRIALPDLHLRAGHRPATGVSHHSVQVGGHPPGRGCRARRSGPDRQEQPSSLVLQPLPFCRLGS